MSESTVPYLDKPIVHYAGDDITCYPSSNATDDGKLNLEFNMARLVTRVSSKNFCIVNPSFELEIMSDSITKDQAIRVGTGQASINGMDLIMTNTITIEPPAEEGHYYLAFHLERDGSDNVEGDTIYGVSTTFGGLSLRYYTEKQEPLTDMDMMYLGELDWNGTSFENVVEDEDKYGRIWAEDVLGKFTDPKHPDTRRLNLQEYIDKIPDWYFSKEGDTVYGPIIVADDRTKNNPGYIINVDEQGSHITVKDPEVDNDKLQFYGDINRDGVIDEKDLQLVQDIVNGDLTPTELQKVLADVNHDGIIDEKDILYIQNFIKGEGNPGDTGNIYYIDATDKGVSIDISEGISTIGIGKGIISEDEADDILHIHNEGEICVDAEGPIKIEADKEMTLGAEATGSPIITINENEFKITDSDAENLEYKVIYPDSNTVQQVLGKAIWQYDTITKNVTLLQDDVNYLDIVPEGVFEQDLTVEDTLHIGPLLNKQTYLKQTEWQIANRNSSKVTKFTPSNITLTNTELSDTDNSYILLKNNTNTIHTQIYDNGKIELLNNTDTTTKILWKDGISTYDVTLEKIKGQKKLNIQGGLNVANDITALGQVIGNGLKTTNGIVTFSLGTTDASIKKDNNANILRTSGDFYIGNSGQNNLYAGNTVINGKFAVGGSTFENSECKIYDNGNIDTTGTITGSKVYNCVYNDYAEVFRKSKDEVIEPGDTVCIKEDGLVHKVQMSCDIDSIIGICSDTEGVLLGGKDIDKDEQVIVGLMGQIWVKSNDENIKPGNMVAVQSNGTVKVTYSKQEKFGIAMTTLKDNKVKIVYNG